MRKPTYLALILALGFIGISSCGDDASDSAKDAEIALLKQRLANGGSSQSEVTTTVTNVSTVTKQNTVTNSSTATSSSSASSTGTSTVSATGTSP